MIKNIQSSNQQHDLYYFTKCVQRMLNRNKMFFFLYSNKLDIIDEETAVLIKSIVIQGNEMVIDLEGILSILAISSSKIFQYSLGGDFLGEIELQNTSIQLEFCTDQEGLFVFFSRNDHSLYF